MVVVLHKRITPLQTHNKHHNSCIGTLNVILSPVRCRHIDIDISDSQYTLCVLDSDDDADRLTIVGVYSDETSSAAATLQRKSQYGDLVEAYSEPQMRPTTHS